LTITGIGVKGSILAPYADVSFTSAHIDGSLIADSIIDYKGEFHQYTFDHETEPVPLPGTLLLFGTGLAGLAGSLRKKKKA